MSTIARKTILKARIDNAITELMVKTIGEQVYLSDNTTVSSKIAEIVTAVNLRAKSTDVTTEIKTAITNLRKELLGDGVAEAYDTFTEFANYIREHEDVAKALTSAVGNKADKTTVEAIQAVVNSLGALAKKSVITESDLSESLLEKVNASAEGNHTHSNKTLLDTYDQTNSNLADALLKKHSHFNKEVLDEITSETVSEWNSKSKVHVTGSQPTNLSEGDLWFQTV